MEVSITDTATGETVTYQDPDEPKEDWPPFIWSEGNYKCDCNRALFFARAKKEPEPNQPCGETRYSVTLKQGEEVFSC